MKIFISHSWRDKTTADLLMHDLTSMVEVWLDIQKLRPGDSITPSIDRAMADMDLVIVLWSQHAAKSDGVAAELDTALQLRKPLILCRIDETDLATCIREVLAIDLRDYRIGYGRLLCTILPMFAEGNSLDFGDGLQRVKDFDGVVDYLENYRNSQGIKGTDDEYWVKRVIESCAEPMKRLTSIQGNIGEPMKVVQEIYDQWNAAGDDRIKLQEVLATVIRNQHLHPGTFKQVQSMIEMHIDRPYAGKVEFAVFSPEDSV